MHRLLPRQTGPQRGGELVWVGLTGLPDLPYAQAVPRQTIARGRELVCVGL